MAGAVHQAQRHLSLAAPQAVQVKRQEIDERTGDEQDGYKKERAHVGIRELLLPVVLMQFVQRDEPPLDGFSPLIWAIFGNLLLERGAHVVARMEPHQQRHIGRGQRVIVVVHPLDEVEAERGVRAEGAHDGHDGLLLAIDRQFLPDGVFGTEERAGVFVRQRDALLVEMLPERRVALYDVDGQDVEQRRVRNERLLRRRLIADIGRIDDIFSLRLHFGPFVHSCAKAARGGTPEIPAEYGADGVEVAVAGDGGVVRVVVANP